jgi:transposase
VSTVIHDRILAQYLCPQILIMDTNFQPVIAKNARGYYRQHPLEFKRALVALSLEPGASVARIAREHGVNANQVFSWRRLYQQGRFGVPALMRANGLLPVVLAPSAPAPNNADADGDAAGTIVLELGEVRVRIEGQPNAAALAQVLDRVLR